MRGTTLSTFDGQPLVQPAAPVGDHQPQLRTLRPGLLGHAYSRPMTRFAAGPTHKVLQYRVVMEPIGTNVVFLITAPRLRLCGFREVDDRLRPVALQNTDRERATNAYTGSPDISQPLPERSAQNQAITTHEVARRYLQLPELDPRVVKLAHDIMARAVERLRQGNRRPTLSRSEVRLHARAAVRTSDAIHLRFSCWNGRKDIANISPRRWQFCCAWKEFPRVS